MKLHPDFFFFFSSKKLHPKLKILHEIIFLMKLCLVTFNTILSYNFSEKKLHAKIIFDDKTKLKSCFSFFMRNGNILIIIRNYNILENVTTHI